MTNIYPYDEREEIIASLAEDRWDETREPANLIWNQEAQKYERNSKN